MPPKKCTKEIVEKCRIGIESGLMWSKVAKIAGVSERSLHSWRRPGSDQYNKEFAEMVIMAEEIAVGRTKAGQFEQSVKHTLVKITRELKPKAPNPPKSWYTKEMLLWYADEVLDLDLANGMDTKEIRYHIERRIEELTVEAMVIVKREETEVDPNQAAVKAVLTNAGPDDGRWSFKEEMQHGIDDPLSKLLAEVAGQKLKLPSEEMVKGKDFQVVPCDKKLRKKVVEKPPALGSVSYRGGAET